MTGTSVVLRRLGAVAAFDDMESVQFPAYTFTNLLNFADDEAFQMTRYVDPRTGEPVTAYSELTQTEWADGRPCSPAEFFFHDVDHARFKLREDLAARGVTIPDAYVNGTTLDPATGRRLNACRRVRGR